MGVQPDAWLRISSGDKHKQAYLEFTREMPRASELKAKLTSYEALFERARPTQVLWFTTSQAKASRLAKAFRRLAYGEYFCVALIEEAPEFLTKPIWRWAGSSELVSFVRPLVPDV